MVQATFLDGLLFNASPFGQDGFAAPEVDVRRCQVADALVVAVVVVVFDECANLTLKIACAVQTEDRIASRHWRYARRSSRQVACDDTSDIEAPDQARRRLFRTCP